MQGWRGAGQCPHPPPPPPILKGGALAEPPPPFSSVHMWPHPGSAPLTLDDLG